MTDVKIILEFKNCHDMYLYMSTKQYEEKYKPILKFADHTSNTLELRELP